MQKMLETMLLQHQENLFEMGWLDTKHLFLTYNFII